MKRLAATLALAVLAACTPQVSEPEATVTAIYKPLVDSKGEKGVDIAAIPMTQDLAKLIKEAESSSDGPVFDFDLAGNCQDCTGFSDLKVSKPAEAKDLERNPGGTLVEASFKVFGDEQHTVYWDMTETPEGWRVDNIMAEGLNLRSIASSVIASAEQSKQSKETDETIACIAYLGRQVAQMPPKEGGLYAQAEQAWRAHAAGLLLREEIDRYVAGSASEIASVTPAEITARATNCAANAPR